MIVGGINPRSISAQINSNDKNRINDYLQGAFYCWCKNCLDGNGDYRWFAARDLFGGDNFQWEETPLFVLYKWHKSTNASDPVKMAGIDIGHMLRDLLHADRRSFLTKTDYVRMYKWTGENYS